MGWNDLQKATFRVERYPDPVRSPELGDVPFLLPYALVPGIVGTLTYPLQLVLFDAFLPAKQEVIHYIGKYIVVGFQRFL